MRKDITKEAFLALVRLGLDNHHVGGLPPNLDWDAIKLLAEEQGLSAILMDGIEKVSDEKRPPRHVLLHWIGNTVQAYEYRYARYCHAVAELAAFYKVNGVKMMLIKGLACGIYWPKPDHRPYGDIDVWLFGKQEDADNSIEREKGIRIDKSEHHHTVFYWRDFMVENHYDFINVHHHKSNAEIERILKELGRDDSYTIEIKGEKVYLPSPNLHALFLIKHMMMHFAAEGITLRQLIDWAFFVKAHSEDVDWDWVSGVLEQYGMKELFYVFNAICVKDLGFETEVFQQVQFNPSTKERVLNDILFPEFSRILPKGLFLRLLYKFKRWRGNAWKHRICYKESMWGSFWRGVWNHFLKPASI